ncbi:sulfotransferase family protein [Streptomyces mayteni]
MSFAKKPLRKINAALGWVTGFQVRRTRPGSAAPRSIAPPRAAGTRSVIAPRPPADPVRDRLLRRPVFIIAPVRSGSTLLRLTLNAHSRLHAPHELHFRRLEVAHATRLAERSLGLLGLDQAELEHLLWDRVLHRELARSGKETLVEKTPGNAFVFRRIATCWPDARFLFLLRHPAAVARSWHEADPVKRNPEHAAHDALRYLNAVERARRALPGHTVRYEELTGDPEATLRSVCDFLDVSFEPGMLEYGQVPGATARLEKGLGDWREKVRSGRVQPARELPPPEELPAVLREICETWDYPTSGPAAGPASGPAADSAGGLVGTGRAS